MGKRIFIYDNREFPDPDPALKVDDVRQYFASFFPELSNAETKQVKRGDDDVISFNKRVGTKGRTGVRRPKDLAPETVALLDTLNLIKSEPAIEKVLGAFLTNVFNKQASTLVYDCGVISLLSNSQAAICGRVKVLP